MKISVGNLNLQTTEDSLRELFAQQGEVEAIELVTDPDTGRSRGIAFVTMPVERDALAAIAALNDEILDGNALRVDLARVTGGGAPPGADTAVRGGS